MGKKLSEITRDERTGLITQPEVNYVFDDNGLIDWRAMISKKWLVPNKDKTNETDVSKLKDNELIILLGGIKELAQIRGYTNVDYTVTSPSPDYVVATCSISWISNYETEGREVTFSAIGDASPSNTNDFAQFYLGPIAENRAFVRCVRNFLRINIVSQEELGANVGSATKKSGAKSFPRNENVNQSDPHYLLNKVMKEKKVSFEKVKEVLLKEEYKNAENFESIEDVPRPKVFNLIARIKSISSI